MIYTNILRDTDMQTRRRKHRNAEKMQIQKGRRIDVHSA